MTRRIKKGGNTDIDNPIEKFNDAKKRHYSYYTAKFSLPFEKILNLDDTHICKEAYSTESLNTNIHIGQRKLLLSEIQLLNRYYSKYPKIDPTLIYIGSATGSHLLTLHKMFPNVKFVLYDYAKFDPKLGKLPNVFELHEGDDGFFTTEKCIAIMPKYSKIPVIFVSDIRQNNIGTWQQFEEGVERDLIFQMDWVKILNPVMSLLKFRIPFNKGTSYKMPYLKGEIYYGIWAPPMSAETRLLVEKPDNKNIVYYDFTKYEQAMFFHNKFVRQYCFDSEYKDYISRSDNPYCFCYDCVAELSVLDDYAKLKKKPLKEVIKMFGKLARFDKLYTSYKNLIKKKLVNIEDIVIKKCNGKTMKKKK